MQMAMAMSKLSTCTRAHHGAIITVDGIVVSTGYNGAGRGLPHCIEVGCHISSDSKRCERSIHAETNAIVNAGRAVSGGTLYVTGEPCERDAVLIVQSQIKRVVYPAGSNYFTDDALREEVKNWYKLAKIRVDRHT